MSDPNIVHVFRYRWPRLKIELHHEEHQVVFDRQRLLRADYVYAENIWWYCTTRQPNGSTKDLITRRVKTEEVPVEIRTMALLVT